LKRALRGIRREEPGPPGLVPVALVLVAVLGFWFLSWQRVATWLATDAQAREAAWHGSATPWHWRLDPDRDIVWPGSHGLDAAGGVAEELRGTAPNGTVELSIALRGGRIDPSLVDYATLWIDVAAPTRVYLLGNSASGTVTLADARFAPTRGPVRMPLHADVAEVLDALRLRVETAVDAQVALRDLALASHRAEVAHPCDAQRNVPAMLERCTAPRPRLVAPFSLRPETMLAWRDAVLAQRPAAIVHPPTWVPRLPASFGATGLPSAAAIIALAGLPLLAVVLSWRRRSRPRFAAALELTLVFLPWLLLLCWGWPGDDDEIPVQVTLLASLAGALLVRSLAQERRWIGSPAAWKASIAFAALGLATIILLTLVDAWMDGAANARSLDPGRFWKYPLWALLQQWILIRMIAPHARAVIGSDVGGALAAGALFGLLHLPNLTLMLATFAAGSAWAWLGYRHRAVLPLVVAHAALGLALVWLAPAWLLRSAEIGGRFLMSP
jgi:hypothetical protein